MASMRQLLLALRRATDIVIQTSARLQQKHFLLSHIMAMFLFSFNKEIEKKNMCFPLPKPVIMKDMKVKYWLKWGVSEKDDLDGSSNLRCSTAFNA